MDGKVGEFESAHLLSVSIFSNAFTVASSIVHESSYKYIILVVYLSPQCKNEKSKYLGALNLVKLRYVLVGRKMWCILFPIFSR